MKLSLKPFPCCAVVNVSLTPLGYVLSVRARRAVPLLWDQVPRVVPETNVNVTVYVDLSESDPIEGYGALVRAYGDTPLLADLHRRAAEWLISPEPMDVNPYVASSSVEGL